MYRIAIIIGALLLLAGVAFAGTRTALDQVDSPAISTTVPMLEDTTTASTTTGTTTTTEDRGRENEPGEDLRGPCDEAEHANDPRCTGAAPVPRADDDDDAFEDRGHDRGVDNRGPGPNSGPSDRSGHDDRGGEDGGGNSGHGGGGDDD